MFLIRIKRGVILYRRYVYCFILILWIFFTIYSLITISRPIQITENLNDNNFVESTIFQYQADVHPYTLNPRGGLMDIDKSIFTTITKDVLLHLKTTINSDKPIKISGVKKVILKIMADEFWEKEFVLKPEESFSSEGISNYAFDDFLTLNISELTDFIKKMENDTKVRLSTYVFEIAPIIDGKIYYNNKEYPINMDSKAYVDYSETLITLRDEKTFTHMTNLTNSIIVPQYYHIFNIAFPLKTVKIINVLLYLLFTGFLIYRCYKYIILIPKKSQIQTIERKYRTRFIPILKDINTSIYEMILLDSFNSMVKLSDEKELLILKYISNDKMNAIYYLIDGKCMYVYQLNSKTDDKNISDRNDSIGSEIA